jgi:hypothetical protein
MTSKKVSYFAAHSRGLSPLCIPQAPASGRVTAFLRRRKGKLLNPVSGSMASPSLQDAWPNRNRSRPETNTDDMQRVIDDLVKQAADFLWQPRKATRVTGDSSNHFGRWIVGGASRLAVRDDLKPGKTHLDALSVDTRFEHLRREYLR